MKFTHGDMTNPDKILPFEEEINAELLKTPENPDIYILKANLELHKGNFDLAEAFVLKAIGFLPNRAGFYSNLAAVYGVQGKMKEAGVALKKGYSLSQTSPDLNWNYSLWLLHHGEFELGWDLYRWRKVHMPGHRRLLQPEYQHKGSNPKGKTLLVWSEQGYGDQIMMFRYLKYIKPILGFEKVIFECTPELYTLFSANMDGIDQVYICSPDFSCPFDFDENISMMDLPYYLVHPNHDGRPYLTTSPDVNKCWSDLLTEQIPKDTKKIGICWQGRSTHVNDKNRSATLSDFAPLANFGQLMSLQKDPTDDEKPDYTLYHVSSGMVNAEYTASLLKELDLVVTVDTFIAHLAGALGVKTYLLLPFANEWRWQNGIGKSNLYNSITMFKQPTIGDWTSPIEEICHILTGPQ